ncbi:MAG: LysR family transcriptional regulator [Burkholderiaceae bacterium]|jgi:DNA-binding transcriptional LysR family regulator|nr:LysR family transcriptional regulator [Burkholderiaceae bacterium]
MNEVDVPPSVWRAFVQVARLRSFSSAARALSSRQSTVSTQIRRLEDQIGQPLFARTTRSVRLTPLAEHLLPVAEEIVGLQSIASARLADAPLSGQLRVLASAPLFSIYELHRLFARFMRTHPDLRLTTRCVPDAALSSAAAGDYDLMIGAGSLPGDAASMRPVRRERLRWYGQRSGVTDLRRAALVMLSPFTSAIRVGDRHVAVHADDLETAVRCVKAGIGVSLLPVAEAARFDLAPLEGPGLPAVPKLDIRIVAPDQPGPAATALRNQLLHWLRERSRTEDS